MTEGDILPGLISLGMDEKQARELAVDLKGGDYVNLVNALGLPRPQQKAKAAAEILSKYGVTIAEETGNMADSKNYLTAMFAKFREGKGDVIETEILGDWLKPISESNAPDVSTLAMEGYNYFMQLEDNDTGDNLMDWLDENKVEYITDGRGQFHIKCDDRESAYKVGKAANGLVAKKRVVRDAVDNRPTYNIYVKNLGDQRDVSQSDTTFSSKPKDYCAVSLRGNSEEEAVALAVRTCGIAPSDVTRVTVSGPSDIEEGKKSKAAKREAEAKAKLANIKVRDPDLLALSQRSGKGAHAEKTGKTDALDRKAKHKKSPVDEAAELSIDNQVAEDDQTDTLAESVLGMKAISPIFRLRELAGMAPAPLARPELDDVDLIEVDHDDSGFNDPLAAGPVDVEDPFTAGVDAEPVDVAAEPMADTGMDDLEPMPGMDAPVDDMGAMDAPMGDISDPMADMGMDPMAAGVPGDLPPMGAEAILSVPTQSEAMSHIEDCLNDIQGKLAEIRLAEYKSLVQKLTSLTQQVQTMGRDYLGEQRKKK